MWVACRPDFFLPVRVLSRLFRRLVIVLLIAAHDAGKLAFFGEHAALADAVRRPARAAQAIGVGRLFEEAVRRAAGRARLSVPLHPPRRHLEPPADERSVRSRTIGSRARIDSRPCGSPRASSFAG